MMTAAEEVAFLAEATGQSAADLLTLPASVYDAIKARTIRGLLRHAQRAREIQQVARRNSLMQDLKQQMGRS
jgi:hypothetical protein